MTWTVVNPPSIQVEMACNLYNITKPADLPATKGQWGIDAHVWKALIDLTYANCKTLGIPTTSSGLKGMCIWASVVAAKFYVHKFAYIDTRVIRVQAKADHYFVSIRRQPENGICDITCNQFGGPDYLTGTLSEVHGMAQQVQISGQTLFDAYQLGSSSDTCVI